MFVSNILNPYKHAYSALPSYIQWLTIKRSIAKHLHITKHGEEFTIIVGSNLKPNVDQMQKPKKKHTANNKNESRTLLSNFHTLCI